MPTPSYVIALLPPTEKGGEWFGYAKDDDWSEMLDGGDDPTPDKTKAFGKTPGAAATAVWKMVKAMPKMDSALAYMNGLIDNGTDFVDAKRKASGKYDVNPGKLSAAYDAQFAATK